MELRDLIVTPVIIILVYIVAYLIRPMMVNSITSGYYFPALTLKIIGAIAVGLVYQFYYQGGDTFNFYTYGSNVIYQAFLESPGEGVKLILNSDDPSLANYTSQMLFYNDPNSFAVIRIASILGLLTFSTYSAIAVLFAFLSFIGMWFLFRAFYELFPHLHKQLAIGAFFIPSVFFWGSGLLKDTIVIGCVGMSTYMIKKTLIDKKVNTLDVVTLLICFLVAFQIKKYVLLCFVPAAVFWIYSGNLAKIKPFVLRIMLLPFIMTAVMFSGFYAIKKVGEGDSKYALDKIAITARETAYDILYYTGKNAGSGYSLGELDGSFTGLLKLAPQAINVSLFRPYIWEVSNPLMLLSAVESLVFFLVTFYLLLSRPGSFFRSLSDPNIAFCFVFSITFAFAVGVSTYNFGSLARYKIPMMPFYFIGLTLIADHLKRKGKES